MSCSYCPPSSPKSPLLPPHRWELGLEAAVLYHHRTTAFCNQLIQ